MKKQTKKSPAPKAAPKTAADAIAAQTAADAALKDRRHAQAMTDLRNQLTALEKQVEAERARAEFLVDARALQSEIKVEREAYARRGRVLSTDRRLAAAVALISDCHIEEQVDPRKVNGLNRFTPAIAEFRMQRVFEGIEWLVREQSGAFDIRELVLGLLGDIITGYIHEELTETNAMSPTQAVVFGARIIGNGIRFLLSKTELTLRIVCKCGNHGRTTPKLRIASGVQNSFEWLLYHMLASEFAAEPRVQFQIDEGHHSISSVFGMRLHTHHGDSVRSNGGIGGIDVPLNRAVIQWHSKYDADLSLIGHFHAYQHGTRLVRNGSLIGYGAYSDWLPSAAPEQPLQAFFLIDSKRGPCQMTGIWAGDTSAEASL